MQFNTHYERVSSSPLESFKAPSLTEPEDCLSIPEILSKYVRGSRIDTSFEGGFEDSDDGRTFDQAFADFDPEAPTEPAPASPTEPAPVAPSEPAPSAPENGSSGEANSTK